MLDFLINKMCLVKIFCVFIILCIPLSIQFPNLRRILQPQKLKNDEQSELQIILEEFEFDNPYIVKSINFVEVKHLKAFFKNNKLVRICKNIHEIPNSTKEIIQKALVYMNENEPKIEDIQQRLEKQDHIELILMLTDNKFNEIYETLEVEIDQPVYFYKTSTQEIFEKYVINNKDVRSKLGSISNKKKQFLWEKDVNPNLILRRANFHGLRLKAMVEFSGSSMGADPAYVDKAPYFSNNQTFLVNGYTYGKFNDVLETLQSQLNFTSDLYKRKEPAWGYIYPQPNGTYRGTGIIKNIFAAKLCSNYINKILYL